jgi:predicted nucleic acid-binding protein
MRIVLDSSTLILLAKIDLLREVTSELRASIPERVREEVLAKQSPDAELIRLLIHEKRVEVIHAHKERSVKLAEDFKLHAGEAEALALAIEIEAPLAVDDGPTIKACKVVGRPFLTAIHFLIHFTETNRISREIALEKLARLSTYGRYKGRIIQDAARRMKGSP